MKTVMTFVFSSLLTFSILAQENSIEIPFTTGRIVVPKLTKISLECRNGYALEGHILSFSNGQITVQTSSGIFEIPLYQIKEYGMAIDSRSHSERSSWPADPAERRTLFTPTASTLEAGVIAYENYNALSHAVSFGISDRITLTGGMTTRTIPQSRFLEKQYYTVGAKVLVFDSRWTKIALGSQFLKMPWSRDKDLNKYTLAYAVYSVGYPDMLQLNIIGAHLYNGTSTYRPLLTGSVSMRVTRHIKLLAEAARVGKSEEPSMRKIFYSYGVRIMHKHISVDAGLYMIDHTEESIGVPMVNVAYTWN